MENIDFPLPNSEIYICSRLEITHEFSFFNLIASKRKFD